MNNEFKSFFGKDLASMIEYKVAIGGSKTTYMERAMKFDAFCSENYPLTDVLSEPIVLHWIKEIYEKQMSSVHYMITFARIFGRYQQSIGKNAFVIHESFSAGRSVFIPYIFSDEELTALFREIDNQNSKSRFLQLQMSTYFRLTYTCGLRPLEGRTLLRKDVDMSTCEIRIVKSKGHRSRTIVMSEDMAVLMRQYIYARDIKYPDNVYLFPAPKGGPYTAQAMQVRFRKAFEKSAPDIDNELLPSVRVYDLRHRFATKVLHNWLDEGIDINSRLPYLQTYMGHKDLNSTIYYIHLLPENLVKSSGINWEKMNSLLPEVELWEK